MHVAAVHIMYEGRSYKSAAKDLVARTRLAQRIVHFAHIGPVLPDVLVLPAGFLVAADCDATAANFALSLPQRPFDIAFGVDAGAKGKRGSGARGYVLSPNGQWKVHSARQMGAGSSDQVLDDQVAWEARIFEVTGWAVGLLMCGEMTTKVAGRPHQPRFSAVLAEKCDLLVDLTHADRQIEPPNIAWFKAMVGSQRPCVLAEHIHRDFVHDGRYCECAFCGPDYSHDLEPVWTYSDRELRLRVYAAERQHGHL